jgi:hypothetical protein
MWMYVISLSSLPQLEQLNEEKVNYSVQCHILTAELMACCKTLVHVEQNEPGSERQIAHVFSPT